MRKLFTLSIVLFPILIEYKSPIPNVDLFSFLILLFFPIMVVQKRISIIKPVIFLVSYTTISTLLSFLFIPAEEMSDMLLRLLRYILLFLVVFILGYKKYFDSNLAIKGLKYVTNAAVAYIIMQTFTQKVFHVVLPRGIYSFVMDESRSLKDLNAAFASTYRPSAFFMEPSYFSQYVLLCLIYLLFGSQDHEKKLIWKAPLFISIGILLSGSGIGIALMLIIWSIYIFDVLFKQTVNISKMRFSIFIVGVAIIILPFVLKSKYFEYIYNRIFASDSIGYNAIYGRLTGYSDFADLEGIFKIIGVGYGNLTGQYFSGLSSILYWSGLLGLIPLLIIIFDILKHGSKFQKIFAVVYSLMIPFASVYNTYLCFYLAFLYIGRFGAGQVVTQKQYKMRSQLKTGG